MIIKLKNEGFFKSRKTVYAHVYDTILLPPGTWYIPFYTRCIIDEVQPRGGIFDANRRAVGSLDPTAV